MGVAAMAMKAPGRPSHSRHPLRQLPPDAPIVAFTGPWRFLSNFYPSPIEVSWDTEVDPILPAPTVEHAYQAMKTTTRQDFRRVLAAPTPAQARALGKTLTAIAPDWDQTRVKVMRDLIEGNTWGDRFWGATAPTALAEPLTTTLPIWKPRADGILVGENWLGRILMERRAVLQGDRR